MLLDPNVFGIRYFDQTLPCFAELRQLGCLTNLGYLDADSCPLNILGDNPEPDYSASPYEGQAALSYVAQKICGMLPSTS